MADGAAAAASPADDQRTDDLTLVLDYVGRSWTPPDVKDACDRLRRQGELARAEIARLRARLNSDAAYF